MEKKKKAEFNIGIVMTVIMAVIIISLIGYFGVKALNSSKNSLEKIDLMEVQNQLVSAAREVRSDFGNQKTVSLKVPPAITELCFITDEHRNSLPYIFRQENPFIMNALEAEDNVYFKGKTTDDFIPLRIESLVTKDGFECFRPLGGRITVTFEGTGTKTRVLSPEENLVVKAYIDPDRRLERDIRLSSPKYLAEIFLPQGSELAFPPGVPEESIIFTEMQSAQPLPGINQFSSVYDLSPSGTLIQVEPTKKTTITISYDPYEMTKPQLLKFFYYDLGSESWKAMPCDVQDITEDIIGCQAVKIDMAKSIVTAQISSFTKYVIGYDMS